MYEHGPRLVDAQPLRYLLSVPPGPERRGRPVLCFLHGYDEAAPLDIHKALTRHGPLGKGCPPAALERFIVVAPQLPVPGDIWYRFADAVWGIVEEVRLTFMADPGRTYLTGFSFGANGVFDLALVRGGFWAAIWPVDPTRIPDADPGCPVWMSFGEVSRRCKNGFIQALALVPAREEPSGERVYLDQGQDHVGSALLAYRDDRIYDWLLSKKITA